MIIGDEKSKNVMLKFQNRASGFFMENGVTRLGQALALFYFYMMRGDYECFYRFVRCLKPYLDNNKEYRLLTPENNTIK